MFPSSSFISSFFRGLDAIEQLVSTAQSHITSKIYQDQTSNTQPPATSFSILKVEEQNCPEGVIKIVPQDLIANIFTFLDLSSMGKTSMVCTGWQQIIAGNSTLQKLVQAAALVHHFNKWENTHQESHSRWHAEFHSFGENFLKKEKLLATMLDPDLLEEKQAAERELAKILRADKDFESKAEAQRKLLDEQLDSLLQQGNFERFAELITRMDNPQKMKDFYIGNFIKQEDFVTLVTLCRALDVSLESIADPISSRVLDTDQQIDSVVEEFDFFIERLQGCLPKLPPEVAIVVLSHMLACMSGNLRQCASLPPIIQGVQSDAEKLQLEEKISHAIQFFDLIECPCVTSLELKMRLKNKALFHVGNTLMGIGSFQRVFKCCSQLEGLTVKLMTLLKTSVNIFKSDKGFHLAGEDLLRVAMEFMDCALECIEETNKMDMLRLLPYKFMEEIYENFKSKGHAEEAKAFALRYIPLNYYNDLYFELIANEQEEEAQALIEEYQFVPRESTPSELQKEDSGEGMQPVLPAHGPGAFLLANPLPMGPGGHMIPPGAQHFVIHRGPGNNVGCAQQ